ncbi:hypothetical protein V8E36_006579 [Tilletia maclaganii]
MSEGQQVFVILGGGVIGLSTGITLLERTQKQSSSSQTKVVIAAEHFPGVVNRQLTETESQNDLQQSLRSYPATYASVWAGAHHVTDTNDSFMGPIVRSTFDKFVQLEREFSRAVPEYAPQPLYWVDQVEHFASTEVLPAPNLFEYYPEYQELEKPDHSVFSCSFRTLDIDTRTYLPWLLARFVELGGVVLSNFRFTSIAAALSNARLRQELGAQARPAAIIVATGHMVPRQDQLSDEEREEQAKDFTLRGQVLRIRAPWRRNVGVSRVNEHGFRDIYVLPFSDGTFVVGGTRVRDDRDPNPQEDVTNAILQRVLPIAPDLRKPGASPSAPLREQFDIFAVGVGLRPSRQGGPRIELDIDGYEGSQLVWAYGFGGTGYQSSWGTASHIAKLLRLTAGAEG